MKFVKQYWYFIIITLITAGLGVVTFLTSQQLTKTTSVAPNVPQVTPKAAEACVLTFNLTLHTGTPTPTGTTSGTPTQTPMETPTNTPTNTPTKTPTPTATLVGCNNSCTVNADCNSGLICADSTCRNPSCTDRSNCTCPASPTPTPVLSGCNYSCTVNLDCTNGLVCIDNACRKATCTDKTNCTCDIAAPTPQTPVAGTGPSMLGATIIGGAFLLILLGIAL